MKIEKVDDNQIRCTLTREDLLRRNMRINELAYGTEKARDLFREMMEQADAQFGFEPGDTPIMIEAVPMNPECLVLVITKVEDPEELDTRFSNFTPSLQLDAEEDDFDFDDEEENFASIFRQIRESSFGEFTSGVPKVKEKKAGKKTAGRLADTDPVIFSFPALHDVTQVAAAVSAGYEGANTLYRDESKDRYLLLVTPDEAKPEAFVRLLARLSEYGQAMSRAFAGDSNAASYLNEHFPVVIRDNALQTLSQM